MGIIEMLCLLVAAALTVLFGIHRDLWRTVTWFDMLAWVSMARMWRLRRVRSSSGES